MPDFFLSSAVGNADEIKEVKEEGTAEEKQKLTEAEEKPAAEKDENKGLNNSHMQKTNCLFC